MGTTGIEPKRGRAQNFSLAKTKQNNPASKEAG
jgi:hypothetical protein